MLYTIEYLSKARRELRKLPHHIQQQVITAIEALATEPRPLGCTKMVGEQRTWRIKAGRDYRVVYDIYDDRLVIDVVRVAHRRDVYKDLA
ncbi:MAG: type II toxin-antitoxin system RelE family toxin [Mycobacteriales bacterium]